MSGSRLAMGVGWVFLILVVTVVVMFLPFDDMPSVVRRAYFSEKAHVGAHLALFAVLAVLAAGALWRRDRSRGVAALLNWRTVALFALVMAVATAQEAVQLWARGLPAFRVYEYFDLAVDLTGALIGLLAFHTLRAWRFARCASRQSPP